MAYPCNHRAKPLETDISATNVKTKATYLAFISKEILEQIYKYYEKLKKYYKNAFSKLFLLINSPFSYR